MKEYEILSCPFCGCEAELHIEGGWSAYVACTNCGAEGGFADDSKEGRWYAVTLWNRRYSE